MGLLTTAAALCVFALLGAPCCSVSSFIIIIAEDHGVQPAFQQKKATARRHPNEAASFPSSS